MSTQSPGSPNRDSVRTPLWESREKCHSDASAMVKRREYYMGEGGGFIRVRAVVSQVSLVLPVACLNTKGAPECELTNLLVGLMQVRVSE